ncbi:MULTISPECIES: polyketide synthase dehydratase domain-containing protein, partial [unclassified Streptomyces]|uniref:polyketide synthase dehydratase domain-containing protein n=1 Tax=unclassified Streptomyces TaxID=2593676 RepID=UPI0036E9962A
MGAEPWLADHGVLGRVLLPATAFMELALEAGERSGHPHLQELAFEAPLILRPDTETHIQIVVNTQDSETGSQEISIFSSDHTGAERRRHARGLLTATPPVGIDEDLDGAWPPAGAERLDVVGIYDQLAAAGYEYGPVFAGVTAAWRHGDDVYAEVSLPDDESSEGFLIHPALMDAALHPALIAADVSLPFVFSVVQLHATDARALRVRLRHTGERTLSVTATDPAGSDVLTIRQAVTRPVDARQLDDTHTRSRDVFHVDWTRMPGVGAGQEAVGWSVVGLGAGEGLVEEVERVCGVSSDAATLCVVAVGGGVGVVADVHGLVADVLGVVQRWLAGELNGKSLVVVTRGAMVVNAGERPADLAGAAVWGLVRSVQVEHPGRVV